MPDKLTVEEFIGTQSTAFFLCIEGNKKLAVQTTIKPISAIGMAHIAESLFVVQKHVDTLGTKEWKNDSVHTYLRDAVKAFNELTL